MEMVEYKNLMPQTMAEKMKMAQVLCKSGLVPNGLNTPEKVFLAVQWGHELGLTPMVAVNNVAVINGKPTISTDLMFSIVSNHKEYAGREIKGDAKSCTVKIKRQRKSGVEISENTFSIEDAKIAGLLGKDVWKKYPARMLKHRAMAYSCRDAFPDALSGLYSKEEIENVNEIPVKDDLPQEISTEDAEVITESIPEEPKKHKPTFDEALARTKKMAEENGVPIEFITTEALKLFKKPVDKLTLGELGKIATEIKEFSEGEINE